MFNLCSKFMVTSNLNANHKAELVTVKERLVHADLATLPAELRSEHQSEFCMPARHDVLAQPALELPSHDRSCSAVICLPGSTSPV